MSDEPTGTTTADGSGAKPTGTTDAGGSGGAQTPEQLQAALAEEQRKNAQLLSERTNVERMRAELEAERAQGATDTRSRDPYVERVQKLDTALLELQQREAEGDPVAIVTLAYADALQRTGRHFGTELELVQTPEQEREAIKKLRRERPNLSVQDAKDILKGKTLAERESELEKREKALADAEAATAAGRVGTGRRPVLTTERLTGGMKKADYLGQMRQLEREGKDVERRELWEKVNMTKEIPLLD